jgi:UDP-N-acetyl-D-mannosaminuronate dehydrogenase
MKPLETLKEKLTDRSTVIGIVGRGYVGLPVSLRFAEVGVKVIGLDMDPATASKSPVILAQSQLQVTTSCASRKSFRDARKLSCGRLPGSMFTGQNLLVVRGIEVY